MYAYRVYTRRLDGMFEYKFRTATTPQEFMTIVNTNDLDAIVAEIRRTPSRNQTAMSGVSALVGEWGVVESINVSAVFLLWYENEDVVRVHMFAVKCEPCDRAYVIIRAQSGACISMPCECLEPDLDCAESDDIADQRFCNAIAEGRLPDVIAEKYQIAPDERNLSVFVDTVSNCLLPADRITGPDSFHIYSEMYLSDDSIIVII